MENLTTHTEPISYQTSTTPYISCDTLTNHSYQFAIGSIIGSSAPDQRPKNIFLFIHNFWSRQNQLPYGNNETRKQLQYYGERKWGTTIILLRRFISESSITSYRWKFIGNPINMLLFQNGGCHFSSTDTQL